MNPSAFRDNIPAYAPPDRADWKERFGKEPVELKDVDARYLAQANRRLERDRSEIGREQTIGNLTVMDEICEGVLHRRGLDDRSHIVHFDPETQSFWDYPL